MAGASLGVGFYLSTIPPASPGLFQDIATVGASLVLAYVVEAVWLVPRVEVDDGYEEWLGFIVGAGLAGFLGVVIALLLTQHRQAGHDNALDWLGLSWSAVSLLILGATLILQPLLADRYRDGGPGVASDSRDSAG
ncbi:MAG TPA: hypothetical protein VF176_03865 [Solirubrobacterales bacterium]